MRKLVGEAFHKVHQVIELSNPVNDSLLSGKLGLVLYYYTLYQTWQRNDYAKLAADNLEQVFNAWNDGSSSLKTNSFSSGLAGLAYTTTLLQKAGLIEIQPSELEELDNYLFNTAMNQMFSSTGDIDFLHGAMGVLHYFNNRAEEDIINGYIQALIDELQVRVMRSSAGLWIANNRLEEKPVINFSLSHGLSAFLLVLLESYSVNIKSDLIRELVSGGIELILTYYRIPDFEKGVFQQFPAIVHPGGDVEQHYKTRLAWCYGDLNIIWLLTKCGNQLNNPKWIKLADSFGKETIKRVDRAATALSDSHFCHGTAGVAQMYKSIYDVNCLVPYNDAYEYWISQTIKRLPFELENHFYAGKETDLLEGLVGVNMVLFHYLNPRSDFANNFLLI